MPPYSAPYRANGQTLVTESRISDVVISIGNSTCVRSGRVRTPTTDTVALTTTKAASARPTGGRLAFLDVMRGIAALGVAFYHLGNAKGVGTPGVYWVTHTLLNPGLFGVLLFFLVSGFIIPASLERHGSIGEFWISRIFRLGPLYWSVALVVFLFGITGLMDLHPYFLSNWSGTIIGNLTITSGHINAGFLIGPAWTLPYELCFYLFTTVLFVTRVGKKSALIALCAGVLALGAADRLLPRAPITAWVLGAPNSTNNMIKVAGLALLLGGAAALLARSPKMALYAFPVAIVGVFLFLNRPHPLHQAMIYLAVMFTGTVIHRIWVGTLRPAIGWPVVAACVALVCGAFLAYTTTWYGPGFQLGESGLTRAWAALAAVGMFLGFLALRDRINWPGPLRWLGRISYSVYLIHWVVMNVVPPIPGSVPGDKLWTILMWLAITLIASDLTFRFIEQPSINLGRRLARSLRARRAAKAEAEIEIPELAKV